MFIQSIGLLASCVNFTGNMRINSTVPSGINISSYKDSSQFVDSFNCAPTSNSYTMYVDILYDSIHSDGDTVDFYLIDDASNYYRYCTLTFNHEDVFDDDEPYYYTEYYFYITYYQISISNIHLYTGATINYVSDIPEFYASQFDFMLRHDEPNYSYTEEDRYIYYSFESTSLNGPFTDIIRNCYLNFSFSLYSLDIYSAYLTSLQNYNANYDVAYRDGYNSGYDIGYYEGERDYVFGDEFQGAIDSANYSGYVRGYNEALNTRTYTFEQLFGAIADTPIMIMYNLLGFDVFGVSALSIVMTMLTGCIVLFLIKRIIL